jgi:hypothetical protein
MPDVPGKETVPSLPVPHAFLREVIEHRDLVRK